MYRRKELILAHVSVYTTVVRPRINRDPASGCRDHSVGSRSDITAVLYVALDV